jgi:hypothetical protein
MSSIQFLYALSDDDLLIPASVRTAGNQMELAMKISLKILSAVVLIATPMAYAGAQTAVPANAASTYSSGIDRGLTRAEVQADLAVWKRAGVDRFWNQDETPDIYSREYRMAYAEYVRLRSGTEYQQELERLKR